MHGHAVLARLHFDLQMFLFGLQHLATVLQSFQFVDELLLRFLAAFRRFLLRVLRARQMNLELVHASLQAEIARPLEAISNGVLVFFRELKKVWLPCADYISVIT